MNTQEEIRSCLNLLKSRVPMSERPTLTKLERLTDELTTEIETLTLANALPAGADIWTDYGMTTAQARVCEALRRAGQNGISKNGIYDHLYADNIDDPPQPKIIDVLICKVRKKLDDARAPYFIETIHGRGYRMWHGAEAYQRRKAYYERKGQPNAA